MRNKRKVLVHIGFNVWVSMTYLAIGILFINSFLNCQNFDFMPENTIYTVSVHLITFCVHCTFVHDVCLNLSVIEAAHNYNFQLTATQL